MSVEFTVSKNTDQQFKKVINKLTKLKPNLEKQLDIDIDKVGKEAVTIMKGNAHVISGEMRDSITMTANGNMSVSVGPTVEYAVYENARGGDHAFIDNSVGEIKPKAVTIVRSGVHAVITKKSV